MKCNQQCIKEKDICCIYMIINKQTKQKYIGQTIRLHKRLIQHKNNHNDQYSYIDQAIGKYGWDNFNIIIIEELPKDEKILNDQEIFWIAFFNTYEDPRHYNLTPGGSSSSWGENHPCRKDFYRVINKGYRHDNDIKRYCLVNPNNNNIKCSYDYEYLNMLASQLNKGMITEKDAIEQQFTSYHIIKIEKRNGKKQYALCNTNNYILTQSFSLDKLNFLLMELKNGNITEKVVKKGKREYRIKKSGKSNYGQRYAIVNPNGYKVCSSLDLKFLEELLYKLKNNTITEEEAKILLHEKNNLESKIRRRSETYRIIKNGKYKNKDRYSIMNPNGENVVTSYDKNFLEDILYKIQNNILTEEEVRISQRKKREKNVYRIIKSGIQNNKQAYQLISPNNICLKTSIFYEVLELLMIQLQNNILTEKEVKNIDTISYLQKNFKIVPNANFYI